MNCTIIGEANIAYHSGLVIGNNNINGWKSSDDIKTIKDIEKTNELNTFLIGNSVDNSYPWNHAGWNTFNIIPGYTEDTKNSQPPILFTVGQRER